jgi:AmpD protein
MKINDHKLEEARQVVSSHASERPNDEITLIVIHGISLPAGHFGGDYIESLFCNQLDTTLHNDFADLVDVEVSSHLLIKRDGSILQFVPFNECAWHAGESMYQARPACNNFSVGIELEGTDTTSYTHSQYQNLALICQSLVSFYEIPEENIIGHSDIAPGRKTDPGPLFDWNKFRNLVSKV